MVQMCGEALTEVDADAEDEGKKKTSTPTTPKLVVSCRFPYLTAKEDHEMPKRYRKARQAQTLFVLSLAVILYQKRSGNVVKRVV